MHVSETARESVTLLIVDDEERNRKLLEVFMKAEGYQTIMAASGQEAIAVATLKRPRLILLDMMMPEMDGFDVARALKGNADTSRIPLIVVSSLDDVASQRRVLSAGADLVLSKPVDRWELVEHVSRLLQNRTDKE